MTVREYLTQNFLLRNQTPQLPDRIKCYRGLLLNETSDYTWALGNVAVPSIDGRNGTTGGEVAEIF